MVADVQKKRVCLYCGAHDTHVLGDCVACDKQVCEHCGNTQFVRGERLPYHSACLKKDDGAFSMIRFAK